MTSRGERLITELMYTDENIQMRELVKSIKWGREAE